MTYADKGQDPKPIIGGLGTFYQNYASLYWPLIRVTAGAILLTHGWPKLMAGAQVFAANSLAKRGIEPALFLAYVVIFLETVGAVLIMLGLFTRLIAALLVIEFLVIVWVHIPNGYAWTGRGYEYPLFWGLVFVAMLLRGGGPYSLDRKLGREV
jgi:putative oxidoreductase